ncbi:MAG TPA: hypothetical protein VF897_11170 [Roseiflexaceae bacterium]
MSEDTLSDREELDLLQDAPVVFVGEPRSLRGEVRLHNRSAEKLVVRDARVSFPPLQQPEAGKTALAAQATISAILLPGQAQHVRVTLDVDRHAPPGEYHGELEIAGQTRPVVLHITEAVRLAISPDTVVIDREAGATVVRRVVFGNDGNVPLTIGAIGRIELGEELLLAEALADGEPSHSIETLLSATVREPPRRIVRPAGFLEVRNLAGPVVLQPGEVRPLDLEIRTPEQIEPNLRYIGCVPLYTSDLEFVIVPASGAKSRRRRSRKRVDERAGAA